MRKISSLTALMSFFIMLLTSFILYIVPQGRVAYWAEWRLWSMSKEQWGSLHINVGILFLISLAVHIYYNWKTIILYLNNKAKQFKLFTREFNIALGVVLIWVIGTYTEVPPFSTLIQISDTIKESAGRKYGEPPYGHAELSSLKSFLKKMDLDWQVSLKLLREAGYKVESDSQTLSEIASKNGVSPQQLYLAMVPVSTESTEISHSPRSLPDSSPPGTGNFTLTDLCKHYQLEPQKIIDKLHASNISAQEEMTLKKIGELNGLSPHDLYDLIKSHAANAVSLHNESQSE